MKYFDLNADLDSKINHLQAQGFKSKLNHEVNKNVEQTRKQDQTLFNKYKQSKGDGDGDGNNHQKT